MTTEPQIVRPTSHGEFLASIPALAGFTPEDSIVFVLFNGTRTIGVARFDRTDMFIDAEQLVNRMRQAAAAAAWTSAAVIVYAPEKTVEDIFALARVEGTLYDLGLLHPAYGTIIVGDEWIMPSRATGGDLPLPPDGALTARSARTLDEALAAGEVARTLPGEEVQA